MPRLLHLMVDDKFFPFTQKLYEAAFPGCNQFRVPGWMNGASTKFARRSKCVEVVPWRYWFSGILQEDLASCDILIIHYMNPWFSRAVLAAPKSVKVVWSGWGGDYYHLLPTYSDALFLPSTAELVARLPVSPKAILRKMFFGAFFPNWENRIAPRIDVASMLPSEHSLLLKALPGFRAKLKLLHYFSTEDVFMEGPAEMYGPDILIGNSATPENNHIEAFNILKDVDLSGRRLIVPLSYGDNAYADKICHLGNRYFGSSFVPLKGYLSLHEYNTTINSCGTVIMNHMRQQALGTISAALYKGAKVYLRDANPILDFYRGKGVAVYDFESSVSFRSQFFTDMPDTDRKKNREIVAAYWSFETLIKGVRRLSTITDET